MTNQVVESLEPRPIVRGFSNGNEIHIFIDSGSSVNLVNADLFHSRFPECKLVPSSETVCDVQARKLNILGSSFLTLCIGGKTIVESFLVIEGLALGEMVLLGHPSCMRHNINILTGVQGITIGESGCFVPYIHRKKTCEKLKTQSETCVTHSLESEDIPQRSFKGFLLEDIELQPRVPTLVKVSLKEKKFPSQVCVVEGTEKFKDVVSTVSVNEISVAGVTSVELVSYQDSVKKYHKGRLLM